MLHGTDPEDLSFHHDPEKRIANIRAQMLPKSSVFGPSQPRHFNLITISFNFFVPWLIFSCLFSAMSFRLHYRSAMLVWMLVGLSSIVVIVAAVLGTRARRKGRDQLWYVYFSLSTLAAILLAASVGDFNYVSNMKPYYEIETMNMYPAVSPASEKGSQMMDAGRIHFAAGTGINMKMAMGFRNYDLYCVAPIVIGDGKMASYDFWAVGTNCCSGVSSDFRCGAYNNPTARSGLRVMHDDERPFFRLAVQQAEAAYGIKSTHPLFFYWVEDPIDEINKYQTAGYQLFLVGIFSYLVFSFICVVGTIFAFASGTVNDDDVPNY